MVRIVKRAPAAEQNPPLAHFLVSGQRLVKEVEQIVVQGDDLLHEFDVLHQPDQIVREQLHCRNRADAARVQRRGMYVTALHQTEHLAC